MYPCTLISYISCTKIQENDSSIFHCFRKVIGKLCIYFANTYLTAPVFCVHCLLRHICPSFVMITVSFIFLYKKDDSESLQIHSILHNFIEMPDHFLFYWRNVNSIKVLIPAPPSSPKLILLM